MVEMGVGEEQVEIDRSFRREAAPERTDAGPGIENKPVRSASDLDAGGIAAISDRVGARRRDAAANTPETGGKVGGGRCGHRARPPCRAYVIAATLARGHGQVERNSALERVSTDPVKIDPTRVFSSYLKGSLTIMA
jgi:hypothetical protein